MKCFAKKNDFIQLDSEFELNSLLMEIMDEYNLNTISVVADKDVTTELLWYAITDRCNFGVIELDKHNYDNAYITTIHKGFDDNEELEIDVCKAMFDNKRPYLVTDCITFIQYNLPNKYEYIEDAINNDFVDNTDFRFFVIGDYEEDKNDDKIEEKHDGKYTYANHVDGENCSSDIYIESTSKELVNAIKEIFNECFVN